MHKINNTHKFYFSDFPILVIINISIILLANSKIKKIITALMIPIALPAIKVIMT